MKDIVASVYNDTRHDEAFMAGKLDHPTPPSPEEKATYQAIEDVRAALGEVISKTLGTKSDAWNRSHIRETTKALLESARQLHQHACLDVEQAPAAADRDAINR